MEHLHEPCITDVAATVLTLMGVRADGQMAPALPQVTEAGGLCDRVFLYNPDAVALWMYEKYRDLFTGVDQRVRIRLTMRSVFPSVTPVCFGSMYSGVLPEVHGIRKYEKPVLKVPTIFDRLPENGKKTAIVSTAGDSISLIFLERNMDYFIYPTVEECNEKAMELIDRDEYDCIVLYNADYDTAIHRVGPEGGAALQALQADAAMWCTIHDAIRDKWAAHRTALAFAPDHGCHLLPSGKGSHGLDEPCDMYVPHFWTFLG